MQPIELLVELTNALANAGYILHTEIQFIPGKKQRFKAPNARRYSKDLFVIIHDDGQGATYGDWHDDRSMWTTWRSTNAKSQRDPVKQALAREAIAKAQAKREALQKHSRLRALQFYMSLPKVTHAHPYLTRKGIRAIGARVLPKRRLLPNLIAIPVKDINRNFQTIQVIFPNGFKRCWKNTAMRNHMIWLCNKLPDDCNGYILICEGYATGVTLVESTNLPVVCALNANNIVNIAPLLREKYPNATLVICADNDQFTKDNPGVTNAIKAARLSNALVVCPDFSNCPLNDKPTDFNDLYLLTGKHVVRQQIMSVIPLNQTRG